MRNGTTLLGTKVFKPALGAGGFVTGGTIANDGTLLVRTDTYNGYSRGPNDTAWTPELRPGINCAEADIDLFYGGDPHPWGQPGTYDVAIAPSNSAVRYMICMGRVWRTLNAGVLYTRLALAEQAGCLPNETSRKGGKPLAVDTQNPAHLFFGSPSTGVRYSTDSGDNWTLIPTSTIPLPTAGQRYIIACDPTSTVTNGRKQGWYVFVQGSGLYRTTNGGANWAAVTAAPSNPTLASHLKINPLNGKVYLTGVGSESNSKIRIFNGTSWTESTKEAKTVAFSPSNANLMWSMDLGGGFDVSNDAGATWLLGFDGAAISRSAPNIPWQQYTLEDYMANGDLIADPSAARLWMVQGIGVWRHDAQPTSITEPSPWVEASTGIENMVTSLLTPSPDGTVGYSCHDRGGFVFERGLTGPSYPVAHGVSPNFQMGNVTDYAPEDTNFWVNSSYYYSGNYAHGYTTDKGKTWTRVDTFNAASGSNGAGQLAVLSKDIWVTLPALAEEPFASNVEKNRLRITKDRGATWTALTIGDNGVVFGSYSFGQDRRVLVKDQFTPGRFYFFNAGDGSGSASDLACKGTWRGDVNLTTGVVTGPTRISTAVPGGDHSARIYGTKFHQVGANDWLWSFGDDQPGLFRSTDGMVTWNEVTGTDDQSAGTKFGEVHGVGIGKAASGSAHKTLYVAGWRNAGVNATTSAGYGFWMSTDNGATWKLDAKYLNGCFDLVRDIAGDPYEFGRFMIGTGGSGVHQRRNDYQFEVI